MRSPVLSTDRSRRKLRVLLAVPPAGVALVLATWFAIHHVPWLGPALADGARAVFGPNAVAWAEDTAYGWQDRWDQWRHGTDAPATYWQNDPARAAVAASAAPAASFDGGASPDAHFPPPPGKILFQHVAAKSDGVWFPIGGMPDATGAPIMVKTMVHPDRERPYTVLAVVAMDADDIRLHAVPGKVEPQDPTLPESQRPGVVSPDDTEQLLAAFNGGWQTIHGHYGMMVNGHTLLPAQPESCTVAIYRDGHLRIAPWTAIASTASDLAAFRQTPPCLAAGGMRHPELDNMYNTSWGAVAAGRTVLRRSAIGLSADGRTLFFGMGDSLTARSIADGMLAVGAYDVAQLDINHVFPRFVFFDKKPGTSDVIASAPLCDGFSFSPNDYIRLPMPRDFFYVTRRVPGAT